MFTRQQWGWVAGIMVVEALVVFFVTRDLYLHGSRPAAAPPPPVAAPAVPAAARAATGDAVYDSMRRFLSVAESNAQQQAASAPPPPVSSAMPADLAAIQDPERLSALGDEAFRARQYARAAAAYQRVLERAPGRVETLNNLGLSLLNAGDTTGALKALGAATQADPSYQRAWLSLGFAQARMGDYPSARQTLQHCVDLNGTTDLAAEARNILRQLPP